MICADKTADKNQPDPGVRRGRGRPPHRRPMFVTHSIVQLAVYRKRNQLRLPNPFVPLPRKTTNTLCNPSAPETGIGKVCHACQPPVTGKVAWATVGPEALSR